MPRREAGVRSRNWAISMQPDVISKVLSSKHELMVEGFKEKIDNLDATYNAQIAPLLDKLGVPGAVRTIYRAFAEELFKAKLELKGRAFTRKVCAIASKYIQYGCDVDVLKQIASAFGVDLSVILDLPVIIEYFPDPQVREAIIPANVGAGYEATFVESAPQGYYIALRYIELITPSDAVGNVIFEYPDGRVEALLANDQPANTDKTYYATDWGVDFWVVKSFTIYGRAIVYTTSEESVIAKYLAGLISEEGAIRLIGGGT